MTADSQQPTAAPPRRRPGRPRGSVTGQGDATRERVIEVAGQLFAEKGFHATSVADIGAMSDLRAGGLYYHIGSKEGLLWEILRRYTEKALAGAERIADSDSDPVSKLGELIDFHVRTIAEHRRDVLIQLRDADALSGENAARLHVLRERVQDCWERVLDEGYRAGTLTQGNRVVANGLLGMVNMMPLWYRPERGDTPESVARQFRAMVLDGLVR